MLTSANILQRLEEIRQADNLCDEIIMLTGFEGEYKKSDFFKITKMPLMKLYVLNRLEKLLSLKELFKNLQEGINGLDAEHFTNLLDQVNTQTASDIAQYKREIDDLNLDFLKSSKKEN